MLPSRSSLAVALGGIVLSFLCVIDCNWCLFVYDALFYSPNNLNNTFASKRILDRRIQWSWRLHRTAAMHQRSDSSCYFGGKTKRKIGRGG